MTRNTLAAVVLASAFAVPSAAQQPCKRNLESGFSYCSPDGWTIKPSLDDKFKTFWGPASVTLTPNINVKDEENGKPLPEVVAAEIKYILDSPQKAGATSVKVLSQSDFIATSGQRGVKVVFHVENTARALVVRTYQYYFSGRGNQILVLTCTGLEADKNTLEPIFDRALKTFQLDQ
jgi:hypothetical protein